MGSQKPGSVSRRKDIGVRYASRFADEGQELTNEQHGNHGGSWQKYWIERGWGGRTLKAIADFCFKAEKRNELLGTEGPRWLLLGGGGWKKQYQFFRLLGKNKEKWCRTRCDSRAESLNRHIMLKWVALASAWSRELPSTEMQLARLLGWCKGVWSSHDHSSFQCTKNQGYL